MNDIKSLLIATTVLAIGGLGLYMYKSEDSELDYIEDDFSESGSDTASESTLEDLDNIEELDYDDYKPKEKNNGGTKKNSKKNTGTRKNKK